MKNLFYLFVAGLIFLVVTSCNDGRIDYLGLKITEINDRITQLEDSIKTLHKELQSNTSGEVKATNEASPFVSSGSTTSSQSNILNVVGTYEFSDRLNRIWVVEINDDETATMSQKGKEGKAYGSWSKIDPKLNKYVSIYLSNTHPIVCFPSGEESSYTVYIRDGYFYKDLISCQAKDPESRLSIKKIK
ncbi:MAG: hypothetical protein K2H96_08830 [Muribaculaceae bacterium]|nr:hypothetical protein [Muribaculaceae bacterium]